MTKFAWIENGVIRDIAPGTPLQYYHSDVAAYYSTLVPDIAQNGDSFVGGVWTARLIPPPPPPPVPIPIVPPKVTPVQFKLLFTVTERIAISTLKATDPVLQDIYSILDDPRLTYVDLALQSTKDILLYLVSKGILTMPRVDTILIGIIT
jgi:hypothetical protein